MLPQYVPQVKAYFDGSSQRIFKAEEFVKGFDYHGQRREVARQAIVYYQDRLNKEPGYRKALYKEIADQWHRNNHKHRCELEPLSFFHNPYRLRGKNRELAKKQGLPMELDRLVLRAVSVLHLAHWRDKGTIQSYFFRRGAAGPGPR